MRLIDADALKEEISKNKKVAGRFIEGVLMLIDNAPAVEYPFYQEAYQTGYEEGYSQGYIDGSTGADWKGGAE